MTDNGILNKIMNLFSDESANDLSDSLQLDLINYLDINETIIFKQNIYNSNFLANSWSERNIFYNCILILTEKRIIIAKNSNSLKIFRDIQLATINNLNFLLSDKDNHIISIKTENAEDIIQIKNRYKQQFNDLKNRFSKTYENINNQDKSKIDYTTCNNCGEMIKRESNFCSNCGKEVKI